MTVITFTSDFGLRDTTVARVKARFMRRVKDPLMVDVSHLVEPHNITEAAFMLRRVYQDFPPGTIHCVFVGAGTQENKEYICLKANGHYFLGVNNGILTSVLNGAKITGARVLDIRGVDTTDEKDLFAAAAGHLSMQGKLEVLGPPLKSVKRIKENAPATSDYAVRGHVIYIDHFGTCVTNISKELLNSQLKGRRASVEVARNRSIKAIFDHIAEVPQGDIAALWDQHGMLCIAVGKSGGDHIKGSNELLGMKIHDWVRIDFV